MHSTLGRDSLKSLADDLELEADRRCVEQMRQVLSRCHRATLKYLAQSPNEFDAKAVCESLALGIDGKGRRQAVIV
ncbi:MAG: hypothetical protein J5I93_05325 [Pirellulaceae bacterium]|nr:hypothetical protein [Pirellulaceae bacterium]